MPKGKPVPLSKGVIKGRCGLGGGEAKKVKGGGLGGETFSGKKGEKPSKKGGAPT